MAGTEGTEGTPGESGRQVTAKDELLLGIAESALSQLGIASYMTLQGRLMKSMHREDYLLDEVDVLRDMVSSLQTALTGVVEWATRPDHRAAIGEDEMVWMTDLIKTHMMEFGELLNEGESMQEEAERLGIIPSEEDVETGDAERQELDGLAPDSPLWHLPPRSRRGLSGRDGDAGVAE
jgi:hypothetical protein